MLFLGVIGVGVVFILWCAWMGNRSGDDGAPRCAGCGYDLTSCDARTTERCPECGVIILETGIVRGRGRGRARRRACFCAALACALAMGFLLLLKYPPVMQSFAITRSGPFLPGRSNPHPITVTVSTEKHPGYTTNPLVFLIPGLGEDEVLRRSFLLERTGAGGKAIELIGYEDVGARVDSWLETHEPPISGSEREDLAEFLIEQGFDVSTMNPPEPARFSTPMGIYWMPTRTVSSPSTQTALARHLGLAPSIGVSWRHTTWVQVSNVVWYSLPMSGTILVFWWLRRHSHVAAVCAARAWAEGS